jgi:tetratricopeptide (TPR) repeat protein
LQRLTADDPARHRPDLAGSLNDHSNRLAALGRYEDALAASTDAVTIYRELAAAHPDAFRPDLAGSLTSLGTTLTELGDFDAALSADREAATIYAVLYSTGPERYRDSLQQAVNNLRIDLRDLGRSEEEIADELDRLLSADDDLPVFATSARGIPHVSAHRSP